MLKAQKKKKKREKETNIRQRKSCCLTSESENNVFVSKTLNFLFFLFLLVKTLHPIICGSTRSRTTFWWFKSFQLLSSNGTFWWIMQCQPSPHSTHLNKCRYEIYRTMRPTCQSDTQRNANAPYFEAVAFPQSDFGFLQTSDKSEMLSGLI